MNTLTFEEMTILNGGLTWQGFFKCALGVAGSAGVGFLGGSAVGTVTLPGIGTIAGSTFGTIVGAAVGAADFCF